MVPVETFRQHQTLRRLQSEAVYLGQRQQQSRQLLAAGNDAEFRGLLDRIGGVEPGIGEPDDLRLRTLRLQQE